MRALAQMGHLDRVAANSMRENVSWLPLIRQFTPASIQNRETYIRIEFESVHPHGTFAVRF